MVLFPVLINGTDRREYPAAPASIPWSMVAAGEARAVRNHGQTLARLAERGGMSPFEILCVLDDRGLWDREPNAAEDVVELARRVADFLTLPSPQKSGGV
jgi:hypothetical protein